MTNTPGNRINLEEFTTRNTTARRIIAGFSTAVPMLADIWQLADSALADVPRLIAEITRLHTKLASTRRDRADLIAAMRATLGADYDGEPDPLWYLRDQLAAHGQLPPISRSRA